MTKRDPTRRVDPGLLEIIGAIIEVLGLADQVQKLLRLDQLRVERRHRRVARLLDEFTERIEDTRTALRVISSAISSRFSPVSADTVGNLTPLPAGAVSFDLPASELPVLARGLDQLHVAIRAMTKTAFALEAASSGIPEEAQRYYRISESGRDVLELVKAVINGEVRQVPALLTEAEGFLVRSSNTISERETWLQR